MRHLTKFEKKKNQRRNRKNGGREWLTSVRGYAEPLLMPSAFRTFFPGMRAFAQNVFFGFDPAH
jgi:hypothetical protein